MDADETIRLWMVGCQSMSSLPGGGRHREAQTLPLSRMVRSQTGDSRYFQKIGVKARTSKNEWKWQRDIVKHPLIESQWNRGHLSMRKWETEKHKSWDMPSEGFKGHVATDGTLLGNAGKWRACGWTVVQLDYDEEMGPLHGMYCLMEGEYEVQRTIKRAELTAFLCFLRKVCGPIKMLVEAKAERKVEFLLTRGVRE